MSKKIAFIGAGSVVFTKTLMSDIMATPALHGSEFALMDPDMPKIERMKKFAERMLKENNVPGTVTATLDRREAITDADFIVVIFQIGGFDAYAVDYEVPLKYGVDQCIGDSLGPGGLFRCLRVMPELLKVARDMEEVAKPGAVMLQYANPMAANCLALGKATGVPFVGLCHGVQTTLDLLAGYCGVPKEEITFTCGGINHMDWFLTLQHNGRDLYPHLREVLIESRSVEYCSYIMEAVVTGTPFRLMGNVRNEGYITNLPDGCCVEVPTFADATGFHPTRIGALPPQLAACCMSNVQEQILTAEAALTGDTEHVVHAAAMDPLAGAVLTLKETRDMCSEMLEAQRPWLPQFEGKKIEPKPTIVIPDDCQPVEVPLDPALAINKRFGDLIDRETGDE